MKWVRKKAKAGDIIRTRVRSFYHYGIFVSNDEVIQFGLPPSRNNLVSADKVKVLSTDLNRFLENKTYEIGVLNLKEKLKARKRKDIVSYARKHIGVGGYNIRTNNCEHFVNMCVFGVKKINKTKNLKKYSKDTTYIFVSKIPDTKYILPIENIDRIKEIYSITNKKLLNAKTYIWSVLEFAFKNVFDVDLSATKIWRSKTGKYMSNVCHLSLSHSGDYVAVAISSKPIGIDIEKNKSHDKELLDKILSTSERNNNYTKQDIPLLWTRKESEFKRRNLSVFIPNITKINKNFVRSFEFADVTKYYLSISCKNNKKLSFNKIICDNEDFKSEIFDFNEINCL